MSGCSTFFVQRIPLDNYCPISRPYNVYFTLSFQFPSPTVPRTTSTITKRKLQPKIPFYSFENHNHNSSKLYLTPFFFLPVCYDITAWEPLKANVQCGRTRNKKKKNNSLIQKNINLPQLSQDMYHLRFSLQLTVSSH